MLYVGKVEGYGVVEGCEWKDKGGECKKKGFEFVWEYVGGVWGVEGEKEEEKVGGVEGIDEE